MNKTTSDMMKIGGAVMAVGAVAAIAAGSTKNNTKSKLKKFAKKSGKAIDGIMDNMQYMFK